MMAGVAGLGLLLTACSPTPGTFRGTAGDGIVDVVASTSVYGDIVHSIGGDKVRVSSIINRTSQDPHSYEASTQDKLAVAKAELVVENGGGYDSFIDTLAADTGLDRGNVINAVDVSGLAPTNPGPTSPASAGPDTSGHAHAGLNEHVWYSLPAMSRLADAIADKLGALEPASAQTFRTNAAAFKHSLGGLEGKLAAIKASSGHAPVAVTEPVPLYLLEDAGLQNKTPAAYTAAIEEDADVPPVVLKAAVDLVASRGVRLLAYNTQTEGPQTVALKNAAETARVPVVNFSETLLDGQSYIPWMAGNVESISKALG
jgi:zinc/manganese transport system substrate-binding protein